MPKDIDGILDRPRKTKQRTKELTNKEFLASAWRELRGTPRATSAPGRSSSTRTAPFSARYRGLCERCGMYIERGDEIRYHRDFSGVVHSGCRATDLTVTVVHETAVVTGTRMPTVCPECHLEHAGPCW
jgi:hypothetical protein